MNPNNIQVNKCRMVNVALLEEIRVVQGVYAEVNQIQMKKNTKIKKGARTQNYKVWQC